MVEATKSVVGTLGLAAMFVGVPLWCAWLVANGVRTGIVRTKGFPYSRNETPIYFWVVIVTYAVVALGVGYFGVLIGLDVWRGR